MSTIATTSFRPQPGEYAPYYDRYISLVLDNERGNDILQTLDEQRRQTVLLLSGLTEADGDLRYAPDKWSAKELLGHLNDTERIMSYRALRFARGDATPIEGYEQDDYVRNACFARCSLANLIEDYIAVRRATLSLFRNLDEAAADDPLAARIYSSAPDSGKRREACALALTKMTGSQRVSRTRRRRLRPRTHGRRS